MKLLHEAALFSILAIAIFIVTSFSIQMGTTVAEGFVSHALDPAGLVSASGTGLSGEVAHPLSIYGRWLTTEAMRLYRVTSSPGI